MWWTSEENTEPGEQTVIAGKCSQECKGFLLTSLPLKPLGEYITIHLLFRDILHWKNKKQWYQQDSNWVESVRFISQKAQELRLTTCMWVKEAFSGSSAGSFNSVKQFSIATPLCCLFLFRSFYRSVYLLPSLGLVTNYRLRGTWRLVMMLLIQDFMSIFFCSKRKHVILCALHHGSS